MDFNFSTFLTLITVIAGLGMPYLISYVAVSKTKWLNLIISWGSSLILGTVSAAIGGRFGSDISLNILLALSSTEASYQLYWQKKIKELQQ